MTKPDTSTMPPPQAMCHLKVPQELMSLYAKGFMDEHSAVSLLPMSDNLSDLAIKGARVVSALVQVLQRQDGYGYWREKDLAIAYTEAFELGQYRTEVPDHFSLIESRLVQKHPSLRLYRLDPSIDTNKLIETLGDELLRAIAIISNPFYRV
ncbi:hypothetical protein BG005_005846 [Podila minutissima]|nr:hypothetical protein BG005_005846 [Podila minutissima]